MPQNNATNAKAKATVHGGNAVRTMSQVTKAIYAVPEYLKQTHLFDATLTPLSLKTSAFLPLYDLIQGLIDSQNNVMNLHVAFKITLLELC